MKSSIVQFCPKFGNIEGNKNKMLEYSKNIESDIIIFPELAFSGYDFLSKEELSKYAFDLQSEIFRDFQDISSNLNKIIVVGYAERSSENFYNSAAMIFPDKNLTILIEKLIYSLEKDLFFQRMIKAFL